MLVQKTNPTGIDIEIARIQSKVWNYLTNTAGWTNYNSYERAYKNPKDNGNKIIPEVYTGYGEYCEVFFNDNASAESYFVTNDTRPFSEVFSADVGYIFQVNLEELYPSIDHRADEEAHKDVYLALVSAVSEQKILNLAESIDDVYRGFYVDQTRFDDMHPCHVFRFNFTINHEFVCYK